MSKHTPRGYRWEKLAAQVKAQEKYCALCWEPIDPTLVFPHPKSFACDHKQSPQTHPQLAYVRSNLQATHRDCNMRKGQPGRTISRTPSSHYRMDDI